jgi:hypothetical protein
MINRNHFQFDCKSLFNFWKTILDLNSLFLHVRLWESATAEHWSLLVARLYHRRPLNFDIRLQDFGGLDFGQTG